MLHYKKTSELGILSRMAWAQYMPIQMETIKTQSIKSKLILSLYGHLTFIFRHCITNKAPKVVKSIAEVLNQKVAKLPSCSFFIFLLSSFLQMGYISQSWLKVAKLLNCSSFFHFSFFLKVGWSTHHGFNMKVLHFELWHRNWKPGNAGEHAWEPGGVMCKMFYLWNRARVIREAIVILPII